MIELKENTKEGLPSICVSTILNLRATILVMYILYMNIISSIGISIIFLDKHQARYHSIDAYLYIYLMT
jgi:hypothetical protein